MHRPPKWSIDRFLRTSFWTMTAPDGLRSQSQHGSSIEEDGILRFWETRYATNGQVWSGLPNQALTKALEEIQPGYALDVGCGEGADALWLAE